MIVVTKEKYFSKYFLPQSKGNDSSNNSAKQEDEFFPERKNLPLLEESAKTGLWYELLRTIHYLHYLL